MKSGKICLGLALAAAVISTPIAAQGPGGNLEFAIGDAQFVLDIPDGFCVPTGNQADVARRLDAGDSQNETPVNIQSCGTFGENYILIKTPRGVPALPMPKAQFLDILVVELQKQETVARGTEIGKQDLNRTLGDDFDIEVDGIGFAGKDEECGYMSGTLSASNAQGRSARMFIGSCGTLVGDRHIFIHSYAIEGQGVTHQQLMARSKAVAMAVSPL